MNIVDKFLVLNIANIYNFELKKGGNKMLRFAHWDGLTYYVNEESPSRHIILVQDEMGKKALINLETGSLEADSQTTNTMSFVNLAKAHALIRDLRNDILDYWNEMKSASNGNL